MKRVTSLTDAMLPGIPKDRAGHLVIENLSQYRQNAIPVQIAKPHFDFKDAELSFDIERVTQGNQIPPSYTVMITGTYRATERAPTARQIRARLRPYEGFQRTLAKDPAFHSNNPTLNLLVKKLCVDANWQIGVTQTSPVNTLAEVIEGALPRAVEIYNTINPDRQLSAKVVRDSILLAQKNDKYLYGKPR